MNTIKPGEPKKPLVDNAEWMQDPLWFKDAVIYELHIKAFFDSDNNGTGDFEGLIQKLDYLQNLGVNTIWLLPFYPSPMRDDGYDIADYRNIYPEYGTMANFKQFVKEAHRRNLKVITEMVINHTSDQHPWFQAARRAPAGSNKRDFYVWSDTDQKFPKTRIIFKDAEKSNWTWDEEAHAYYWHRFFFHQPDLNFNNPKVVKAVIKLMRFWLDLGVDGLRLDAIPYLCVREGTQNENLPGTHAVIKQMRAVLDAHYPRCVFLAEVNQWPEDVRDYFSDGDECQMAYHFPLMPRMYMAIAQEDRHPIVDIMRQTPDIPETCQWAIFLRNHDELTLEMVTDKERDYMYQMYVGDPRARVKPGPAHPANRRADANAQLAFAVEPQVTMAAGVRPACNWLQFINDFHRAKFRRARDAAAGKTGGERGEVRHTFPQPAFHSRNQMLHLRKFLQLGQLRHLHGTVFANFAQIIAQQVGDHHKFREFLGAGLQFVSELRITGRVVIARARAFDRARNDLRTAQAQKLFRRGGGDLKPAVPASNIAIQKCGEWRGRNGAQFFI